LQSTPNSLLERNDKFIVVSKSRAPDESVFNKDVQLFVDSKLILNSEGARSVPITSYSVYEGAQRHSSGNVTEKMALIMAKVFIIESMRIKNSEAITLATILFNKQTYLRLLTTVPNPS
jgi:hypothetical protein